MRLSQVSGDRVFDVIAGIIDPVSNIASDAEVMELFKAVDREENDTDEELFFKKLAKAAPSLIRNHKDELVQILSLIEGVDEADYVKTLTIPKLIGAVYDIFTDEDLLVFLPHSESAGLGE